MSADTREAFLVPGSTSPRFRETGPTVFSGRGTVLVYFHVRVNRRGWISENPGLSEGL
jgi:hypothetical protein